MEQLYDIFNIKLRGISLKYKRFLFGKIDWSNRLISLLGARGTGKTTLILQHIKEQFKQPGNLILYVDVNHPYFSQHTILELADTFYKKGGKFLFLDEIHKYYNWSTEIKQVYDTYFDLNIVFTGSSVIEILKGEADLSRRVVSYLLPGLSFREYLELDKEFVFEPFNLQTILSDHREISNIITQKIRPLEFFQDYLRFGYYPFFVEGKAVYLEKLLNTINLILEVDVPAAKNIDLISIKKMKKLLSVISTSVPFKPNTHKLSVMIEVSRLTLVQFFYLLENAQLLNLLHTSTHGVQSLGKPEKIYLNNPNLMYALAPNTADVGTIRETFFFNQTKHTHLIQLPEKGDFLVDQTLIFEVGGKNKSMKQISNLENAWVVADEIEYGFEKKIPLWMFGFQY
jgi:predicted AAA+ superfamily ATPase